jgi:hypothetical protein
MEEGKGARIRVINVKRSRSSPVRVAARYMPIVRVDEGTRWAGLLRPDIDKPMPIMMVRGCKSNRSRDGYRKPSFRNCAYSGLRPEGEGTPRTYHYCRRGAQTSARYIANSLVGSITVLLKFSSRPHYSTVGGGPCPALLCRNPAEARKRAQLRHKLTERGSSVTDPLAALVLTALARIVGCFGLSRY